MRWWRRPWGSVSRLGWDFARHGAICWPAAIAAGSEAALGHLERASRGDRRRTHNTRCSSSPHLAWRSRPHDYNPSSSPRHSQFPAGHADDRLLPSFRPLELPVDADGWPNPTPSPACPCGTITVASLRDCGLVFDISDFSAAAKGRCTASFPSRGFTASKPGEPA